MANIIPKAFKTELLSGTHNFANGGDSFKLALYTSVGNYADTSTVYLAGTSNAEVNTSGTSYPAGGETLLSQAVALSSSTATVDFADRTFSSVSLTASHAAIYNDTNSDKLCLVLDFGGSKTATNGDFVVQFPTANASDAIIRIA
jgi:hypothetical protein